MKQDVYPEINLSQRIIYALNETYQQGEKVYYDNGSRRKMRRSVLVVLALGFWILSESIHTIRLCL